MAKKAIKTPATKPKAPPKAPPMTVRVVRRQSHFYKNKLPRQDAYADKGLGTHFLLFEITAGPDAIYIPNSIATGRKSAGFLYVVEGDDAGEPTVAIISKRGEGVTTVTSGSVVYTKIDPGKTGVFIVNAEVIGSLGSSYSVIVSTISYKNNPNDYRYKKFSTELKTDILEFRSK